jgi:hypothetical protein
MSVKSKILQWQAEIKQAKEVDYKDLLAEKDRNSQEITNLFPKIQAGGEAEAIKMLSDRIDELNESNKKLDEKYKKGMKRKFRELYKRYPNIYQMLVEGNIASDTLEHVLTAHEKMERGQVSEYKAVSEGMDFMTQKYNLPSDFFNRDAIPRIGTQTSSLRKQ